MEKEPDDGSLRLGRNRARSELDLLSPRPDPGDLSPSSPFDIRLEIRKPEPSPGASPVGTPGASPIGTPSSAAGSDGLGLELVPGPQPEPQPVPEPEEAEDADLMHTVSLDEMKPGHHHGHGHHKPPQTGPVKVGLTMIIHL